MRPSPSAAPYEAVPRAQEELRSKHVRTLELLQATLDENKALKAAADKAGAAPATSVRQGRRASSAAPPPLDDDAELPACWAYHETERKRIGELEAELAALRAEPAGLLSALAASRADVERLKRAASDAQRAADSQLRAMLERHAAEVAAARELRAVAEADAEAAHVAARADRAALADARERAEGAAALARRSHASADGAMAEAVAQARGEIERERARADAAEAALRAALAAPKATERAQLAAAAALTDAETARGEAAAAHARADGLERELAGARADLLRAARSAAVRIVPPPAAPAADALAVKAAADALAADAAESARRADAAARAAAADAARLRAELGEAARRADAAEASLRDATAAADARRAAAAEQAAAADASRAEARRLLSAAEAETARLAADLHALRAEATQALGAATAAAATAAARAAEQLVLWRARCATAEESLAALGALRPDRFGSFVSLRRENSQLKSALHSASRHSAASDSQPGSSLPSPRAPAPDSGPAPVAAPRASAHPLYGGATAAAAAASHDAASRWQTPDGVVAGLGGGGGARGYVGPAGCGCVAQPQHGLGVARPLAGSAAASLERLASADAGGVGGGARRCSQPAGMLAGARAAVPGAGGRPLGLLAAGTVPSFRRAVAHVGGASGAGT